MTPESPPAWLAGLTKRIDTLSSNLEQYDRDIGQLMGGIADMRREVNKLTRAVERLERSFNDETKKRLEEDLSIREALSNAERRLMQRNAGAGAGAGAIIVALEWILTKLSSGG